MRLPLALVLALALGACDGALPEEATGPDLDALREQFGCDVTLVEAGAAVEGRFVAEEECFRYGSGPRYYKVFALAVPEGAREAEIDVTSDRFTAFFETYGLASTFSQSGAPTTVPLVCVTETVGHDGTTSTTEEFCVEYLPVVVGAEEGPAATGEIGTFRLEADFR